MDLREVGSILGGTHPKAHVSAKIAKVINWALVQLAVEVGCEGTAVHESSDLQGHIDEKGSLSFEKALIMVNALLAIARQEKSSRIEQIEETQSRFEIACEFTGGAVPAPISMVDEIYRHLLAITTERSAVAAP